MLGRRAVSRFSVATAVFLACVPVARAQPQEAPPPVVQNVPPPPVVQNVPPPPVVQPVAPEPTPPAEPRGSSGKLFLSGLGTFVLAYGLTILAGAIATAEDDPAGPDLYIPVAGPVVFWSHTNNEIDAEGGLYLILSVVFQTAGIVGMVAGLGDIASGTDSEP